MHRLEKEIGGKEYLVFGPNAIMLDWARRSELAKSVYSRSGLTEDTLFRVLWRAHPELGPYPFLDTLSDFEFNRQ